MASTLRALSEAEGEWAPLLVRSGPDGPTVAALLAGDPEELRGAVGKIRGEEPNTGLLSFRNLMKDLSRIRHDINNPLTAAFAEVQLLMMDVDPASETGEALGVVEEQLFRIRDLVAELSSFRPPLR